MHAQEWGQIWYHMGMQVKDEQWSLREFVLVLLTAAIFFVPTFLI